jgi:LacI family transcriptional regulator
MGVQRAIKAVQHYGLLTETLYFDYSNPKSFVKKAKEILKDKPDGVLFPPMFSKEAHWLLEQCEGLNIARVIINTNIDDSSPLSYIGQDSYQSGVLGARLLDFALNSGQTVCIMNLDYGTKVGYHLRDKERGFRDYFEAKVNKEVNIFRVDFEEFYDPKALEAFLIKLLDSHPDLSGIFVTNSRAYKIVDCTNEVTDRKIKIVGFDLVEANLHYLRENKIDFLINQNPMDQGFLGIISLFKHLLLKEAVEEIQYLPLDIVVKENAEYYVKRQTNRELIF